MKINIFIPSLVGGGAERVVSDLVSHLHQYLDITVSVCSLKNQAYSLEGGRLIVYENQKDEDFLSNLLYSFRPRIFFYLYKHILHIRKNRYDLTISFLALSNIINLLVSRILSIPSIVSIRNNPSLNEGILLTIQKYLISYLSPYSIFNSEYNKEAIALAYHLNKDKCISIYNPKNIPMIRDQAKIPVTNDFFETDDLILLTVGRLNPVKGHTYLLRIFSKLRQNFPCRLVLCGVGELESELKQLAHDLKIEEYVLFTGWTDNPYCYMNRADIFVFTSLSEGQPNALIEALICGCPIVSADCDYGPREILADGKYGILTKKLNDSVISDPVNDKLTDSEMDMYTNILYLLEHPEVREHYSKISDERAGAFDHNMIINKYLSVFKAAKEGKMLTDI